MRALTEYGRSGVLPAHSLEHYDTLAKDLVDACQSGRDDAMRRVIDHFHIERMLTWDRPSHPTRVARLRRYLRERLGGRPDAETENETLALADAQLLIARSHGFEVGLSYCNTPLPRAADHVRKAGGSIAQKFRLNHGVTGVACSRGLASSQDDRGGGRQR